MIEPTQESLVAAAIKKLHSMEAVECMDPINMNSRPTKSQSAILDDFGRVPYRYVVAGNQSGKTQLGSREVAWVFEENHPNWKRPVAWANEPLLIIVVGRTSKQVEEVLWRKISGFLDKTTYKVQRIGGVIQKVTHLESGNVILFASHHNENEAREKLQAFVAHYVWIDEMPGSFKLVEELQRRVQSRDGYFLATFTPKVRNDQIRKLVDNAREPYSCKYNLVMFDNPGLSEERKQAIIHEAESYSESYRNTVLYGAWSAGEQAVYDFRKTHQVSTIPKHHKGWRHVLSVDPAMASKLGMTLWAEDPASGHWYCIRAECISNLAAPIDYVQAVEGMVEGHNIVRRVADTEPWYVGTAARLGYTYVSIYNKSKRKNELIKNLQSAIADSRIKVATWCTELVDEFVSCQWSETVENKIVNSQRFHLLDSAQYFVDNIPKGVDPIINQSFDNQMLHAHFERKKKEAKLAKGGQVRRRSRTCKKRRVS